MIVTDLDHAAEQLPRTPRLQRALAFLKGLGPEDLADGRIEIDGDRLYALVQTYDTRAEGEWAFEGHRRYIDIQFVAEGEEVIGWAAAEAATITVAYDDAKDAWLGTVPRVAVTPLRLAAGQFAVFYPSDAHAPKRAAGASARVRKVVVKVAIEG